MSGNRCAACFIKDGIIAYQKARIASLTQEVKRLKAIIQRARQVCAEIINRAEQVMSSHQPRGKWSFARGISQAAQEISRRLAG